MNPFSRCILKDAPPTHHSHNNNNNYYNKYNKQTATKTTCTHASLPPPTWLVQSPSFPFHCASDTRISLLVRAADMSLLKTQERREQKREEAGLPLFLASNFTCFLTLKQTSVNPNPNPNKDRGMTTPLPPERHPIHLEKSNAKDRAREEERGDECNHCCWENDESGCQIMSPADHCSIQQSSLC